jgi:hypothetical protein
MAKVIELQTMTAYKERLSSKGKKIAELLRRGGKFLDLIDRVQYIIGTMYYLDTDGKVYYAERVNEPVERTSPFNDIGGNNSRLCYSKDAAQRAKNFCDNLQDRYITNVLRPLWYDYGAEVLMREFSGYFTPRVSEDEYYQTIHKFEGDVFAMKCARDLFRRTLAYTNKSALLDKLFDDEPLQSFSVVRAGKYDFASDGGYYNDTFQRAYSAYLASVRDDVFIPIFYHRSSNGEARFFFSLKDDYIAFGADTPTETATLEDDLEAFVQEILQS